MRFIKTEYKNGDLVGAFVFVKEVGLVGRDRTAIFLCHCGNEFEARITSVKNGKRKYCHKCMIDEKKTHGYTCRREHDIWFKMKARCYNQKTPDYERWGGRGITVCDRWMESFNNFIEDMGDCPPGYTLERKDNEKGYYKENCRWATRTDQARNRRTSKFWEYKGERLVIAQWAERLKMEQHVLSQRVGKYGWSIKEALETPSLPRGGNRKRQRPEQRLINYSFGAYMLKTIVYIALFLPMISVAQSTDTADHVSDGEYFGLIYKASTHKAYNFLSLIPALCTGQPTYVGEVYGGPHDAFCVDQNGNLYGTGLNSGGELGIGSQSATGSGAFVQATTDSGSNTVTGVTQVLNSGTNFGTFWFTAIVMNGQVELAGNLQGGLRGAGIAGAAVNTKFVPVTFPGGAYIKKVTGLYTLLALDTTAGGRVWSWGGNNNLAQLGRGSSPSPNYETPGLITLSGGRHAVDIASAGAYGVILLDDGEMLGIGDHPTFWGGSSQGSSNSPQNFSTFFYTYVKTAAGTEDTVKKVFCNDGSIYYITYDSTLWSMGDNICGTIGNGQMANWATYTFAPAPTGGTLAPWAYDNGYGPTGVGELPVYTPYNVAPGTHNWECGYPNPSNCWFTHFVNNKHETWGWGRDKAGQLVDSIGSCNYTSGGLNGSRPDVPDNGYPHIIKPFTWSSVTQVNCPECFTNPSFDANCSQCSQTQGTAPTVNAGANQILSANTTSTTMSGTATGAGSTKIFNLHYSFVSSTNGSVPVITFPGSLTTPVSGLQAGVTYTLQLTATDQVSVSNTSNVTITVGTGGIGPIIQGSKINVVSLDTVYNHSILASTSAYYVLDTLSLPPNSQGVFNLSYCAYDTVQKFTGVGQQTVMVSRLSTIYGAPYISYQSPYVTTGLSVHQSEYNVTLVNGLPLVRVSGFGIANPIRWHVMRHQNIMPL